MAGRDDKHLPGTQNISVVRIMEYVNLIIDNVSDHTDSLYTYGSEIRGLKPGDKVVVPFSRGNRHREAYVHSIADSLDPGIKVLKKVVTKDEKINLSPLAMKMCCWMRERYMCRYIDAVKCFVPPGKEPKRRSIKKQRESAEGTLPSELPSLTEEQENVLAQIHRYIAFGSHQVFLLHGVTSSGKTEIYMRAISECILLGKTALMLLPEIALTTQIIERFSKRFGEENLAIMHSGLSLGRRYEEWMKVKEGRAKIVVGARSAVFAPLDNIGVVILDEEHEGTYKSDMAPKYDTAEVAVSLAEFHKAVVILGSATPSLASVYKAKSGDYKYLRLTKRYNEAPLPDCEVVDMRNELRSGNKTIFSRSLYSEIRSCLSENKQIILFLNRRGYTTFLACRNCGYAVRCNECNISLTYHKALNAAICHYCGLRQKISNICPECGKKYMKHFGAGTEKVEELAKEMFQEATIDRLDMDTSRKKGSTEAILARFSKGKTDILIGTQLVAKGLDFENVGLVGIVAADVSLNLPDYRSSERTFQLITQAAGRAGRGDRRGKVIIQTYSPDHYAIKMASMQDYRSFYEMEIGIRRQLHYPPFSDLIQLILTAEDDEEACVGAEKIKDAFLRRTGKDHGAHILGPRPAPIARKNERYRWQILIKCLPQHWGLYQKTLFDIKNKVVKEKGKRWTLSIDVNPYGLI